MPNIRPVIGEQYRFDSLDNPFYGIGTVTSVLSESRTGMLFSEVSGEIPFSDFDLCSLRTDRRTTVENSAACILVEIHLLQKTEILPRSIKSFADLDAFIDSGVLILKHIPRKSQWIESGEQKELEESVLAEVNQELSWQGKRIVSQ